METVDMVDGSRERASAGGGDADGMYALAELEEKAYPLPENWPRIKQLNRPMSCALSISRLPCVRKAVSHLELIQNIIDEWFRRTVDEVKSRGSTVQSVQLQQVPVSPKKHLRFRDPSTRSTCRSTPTIASKRSFGSSTSTMSVEGFGAVETPQEEEEGLEIPYLGAEDVIEETMMLLARLEVDRQETQENLTKELDIVAMLKKKINDVRMRRLRELPLLVQREHQACIVDLKELNWHIAYTQRTQAKSQNRKDIAEVLNDQLKKDIAFVKQHIPLVKEKLVLELQAMDRIKKAQVETNQELMTTKQRQAKTEQKSTEALTKAETERGHVRRELDTVRDNLTQISEELSTAKMTFNSYVHQVNDVNTQLLDNAQELIVLEVKNGNAKAAEEMQATKVRSLQNKIAEGEFEYQRLANENSRAEEELRILCAKNAALLSDLINACKALESKLRTVMRKNQELEIIIQDTQDKISKSEQQKVMDEKNIRRILRELERVAAMMEATTEEHMRIAQMNHHIRDKLSTAQEKAFRTEESLKNTAESLRRQVKEEIHTRTVLQARIISDFAEIEKTRAESAKKKDKADKVAQDVGSAVNDVLAKVEKLRASKGRKNKQIMDLQTELVVLEQKHSNTLSQFRDRLASITPHYQSLKEEIAYLEEVIGHLLADIQAIEDKRCVIAEERYQEKCKVGFTEEEKRRLQRRRPKDRGSRDEGANMVQKQVQDATNATNAKKKVYISKSDGDIDFNQKRGRRGFQEREVSSDLNVCGNKDPNEGRRCRHLIERIREEVSKLDKQLDHMAWKTELMQKKIEEMDGAQGMMDKVSTKTQASIIALTAELEELQIQLNTARKIGNDLRQQYQAVIDRVKDGETRQYRFMAERTMVLKDQEGEKVRHLADNKELASRYRQLQNDFFIMKEKLLRGYDDCLKLEATITDVKQLKSLQSKMHGALAEYFKLSGLYNEAELVRLEQLSSENGMKVGKLQGDMEEALTIITDFLQTEMDGNRARQVAWEAVKKMDQQKRSSSAAGASGGGLGPRAPSSVVMAS